MKEWFISGAVHLAVGFVFGWLVFKRPELIEKAIALARKKIGL